MLKDKFKTAQDKKIIDKNDYWLIENNPLTKIGVFPYLGRQISSELEPDKIYQVLRPKEELTKPETLKSLELIPLVDEHTMLGDKQGHEPAEKKGIHGVTGTNVKIDGDLITNDLKIYSETLKDEIKSGKKDLSLGYYCKYDLTPGEYNGAHYDALQKDIIANHIALVDEGRMGKDVRVMDSMITYDCSIRATDDKEPKEWITVKGNHIPVKEGQTKKEAGKNFVNSKKDKNSIKKEQFEIIQKNNPLTDDYHVGIRSVDDIKTFAEAIKDDESFVWGDYSEEDAQRDLKRGKVTVYSSKNIENGGFVSTSKNQAKDYAGGGKIYSMEVNIDDVAWINGDEGQFARVTKKTKDTAINKENNNMAEEKQTQDVDKRELIREVMAIAAKPNEDFDGGEEEKIETIAKKLETMSYNPSEAGGEDEEPGAEIKQKGEKTPPCEDEGEDKRKLIDEIGGILNGKVDEEIVKTIMAKAEQLAYNNSEAGGNDEDPEEEEKKEDEDKPVSMDEAIKYLAQKDALVQKIKPIIGDNYKFPSMTIKEVVKYACDKLDIKNSLDTLEGYLKGKAGNIAQMAVDNAIKSRKTTIQRYLNDKKGE